MMNIKSRFFIGMRFVALYVGLLFLYTCILTLVYIPSIYKEQDKSLSLSLSLSLSDSAVRALKNNIEAGLSQLAEEGRYPKLFPGVGKGSLQFDNPTDTCMLQKMLPQCPGNALESALYMDGYSRYWHGYAVILRPLLTVFSYSEIRFFNCVVLSILFAGCALCLYRRMGPIPALSFIIAIIGVRFLVVPFSLQFVNLFSLLFLSVLVFCCVLRPSPSAIPHPIFLSLRFAYLLFIVGSLTAFVDLLTTPLLPGGMLIALAVTYDFLRCGKSYGIMRCAMAFLLWSVAYGGTWVAKWCIADCLLHTHVVADGIANVFARINGTIDYEQFSRVTALKANIHMLFDPLSLRHAFYVIPLVCICMLLFVRRNATPVCKKFVYSMLFISCVPYGWYLFAANHSQIHYWFAFRSQAITIYCLCLLFMCYTKILNPKSPVNHRCK